MVYENIFKSLANKELILPFLENQIISEKWPMTYPVTIDSSPYYGLNPDGTVDGYFHPSTHSLMGERELYYRLHPDHRDHILKPRRNLQDEMTLAMGSALHGVLQTQMQMIKAVPSEKVEVEYIIEEHHVRGRIDWIFEHPTHGDTIVEMKALDCATPVLTTAGWSTMGDLRDGDEVYAPDGQPTKVVKAHPIRVGRPCYEVKLRDGQSVVADEDHLWQVTDRWSTREHRVMTTKELAESKGWGGRQHRFCVPVTEPLQAPEANLPIDPWLLGMWLGDGSSRGAEITSGEADLPYLLGRLEVLGQRYRVYRYGDRAPRVSLYGLRGVFSGQELLHCPRTKLHGRKHIPQAYLSASESQRRQVLAGLMDSDGAISDHQAMISMVDKDLMKQVLQLVRSLGYRATWAETRAKLYGVDKGPVYWVKFSSAWGQSPFDMPRKAAIFNAKGGSVQNLRQNSIVAVTPVETRPTRCITVAHESSLYVVGEGFVPTHNTRNIYSYKKQAEIEPSWDAQLSLAEYSQGHTSGVLLMVESGWPYNMKEFRHTRNDALLEQIFYKFDYVRECIAANEPPKHCCPYDSAQMSSCAAKFRCWLAA